VPVFHAVAPGRSAHCVTVVSLALACRRWALQTGAAIIPRAASPTHIDENADLFSFHLTQTDVDLLSALAWFVRSPWNAPQVPDAYGLEAAEADLRSLRDSRGSGENANAPLKPPADPKATRDEL
jgi:hypothetical protein